MNRIHKLIAASSIVLAAVAGATSVASTSVAGAAPASSSHIQFTKAPMRQSPVAAFLGHAVISCAQGALASVGIDILRDVASGGDAAPSTSKTRSSAASSGLGSVWPGKH